MPLRRITFSGRFISERDQNKEWWKIVAKGTFLAILDISILLAVGITSFYLFAGYIIRPHERGFYCNDTTITKKFGGNTITTTHLLLISLASPLFIIAVLEGLFFYPSLGSNKLAKYLRSITIEYLEYLLVYTLCTFLMEFFKCYFGRLRPHFLDACQPDWSAMDCTTDPNAYISEIVCSASTHRMRVSRTSFPSGHTAAACFVLLYVYFYINRLIKASGDNNIKKARTFLMIPLFIWTVVVMVTRVTDYWHHPTDVVGGIALALICAVPIFGTRKADKEFVKRELDPRSHRKAL